MCIARRKRAKFQIELDGKKPVPSCTDNSAYGVVTLASNTVPVSSTNPSYGMVMPPNGAPMPSLNPAYGVMTPPNMASDPVINPAYGMPLKVEFYDYDFH